MIDLSSAGAKHTKQQCRDYNHHDAGSVSYREWTPDKGICAKELNNKSIDGKARQVDQKQLTVFPGFVPETPQS